MKGKERIIAQEKQGLESKTPLPNERKEKKPRLTLMDKVVLFKIRRNANVNANW